MRRRLVVLGVVGFWAVMMATLVRRWILEVKPQLIPGTYRSVLTAERRNYQQRMGIYIREGSGLKRVGYTQTVFLYHDDGRYSIHNTTRMRVPVAGLLPKPAACDIDTSILIGKNHGLERLTMRLDSGVLRAKCRGIAVKGKLVLKTQIDGAERVQEVPLPQGGMVTQSLSPLLALPPLKVNQRWSMTIVDPLTFQASEVEVEVLRREPLEWEGETRDTHVVAIRYGDLSTLGWVSRDGEVLKEQLPILTLIKERVPTEEGAQAD